MSRIPSDQQSPHPGGQHAAVVPAAPDDQAATSAISGPPTTNGPLEFWSRETVLKFFGGDKPLHQSTLYRGMESNRYPRPIMVAGNAARWFGLNARKRGSACSPSATNRE